MGHVELSVLLVAIVASADASIGISGNWGCKCHVAGYENGTKCNGHRSKHTPTVTFPPNVCFDASGVLFKDNFSGMLSEDCSIVDVYRAEEYTGCKEGQKEMSIQLDRDHPVCVTTNNSAGIEMLCKPIMPKQRPVWLEYCMCKLATYHYHNCTGGIKETGEAPVEASVCIPLRIKGFRDLSTQVHIGTNCTKVSMFYSADDCSGSNRTTELDDGCLFGTKVTCLPHRHCLGPGCPPPHAHINTSVLNKKFSAPIQPPKHLPIALIVVAVVGALVLGVSGVLWVQWRSPRHTPLTTTNSSGPASNQSSPRSCGGSPSPPCTATLKQRSTPSPVVDNPQTPVASPPSSPKEIKTQ
eukprot:TRINITY_DN64146_c0_g2_i1.p1 TRINITY_DN64146_c0_g2~~TRINITY_DN64146_c0_g2_i1.p1  ORF type:complete len:354 (-),score=10.17 TRINITY_DN64146_c0_g2_i1:137-1198(-)